MKTRAVVVLAMILFCSLLWGINEITFDGDKFGSTCTIDGVVVSEQTLLNSDLSELAFIGGEMGPHQFSVNCRGAGNDCRAMFDIYYEAWLKYKQGL